MKEKTNQNSKAVVEKKILEDLFNSGEMTIFISNQIEKNPANEELRQMRLLFCCGCDVCDDGYEKTIAGVGRCGMGHDDVVKKKKPKAKKSKPKKDDNPERKKRVLSDEQKAKMQEARLAKKKAKEQQTQQQTQQSAPEVGVAPAVRGTDAPSQTSFGVPELLSMAGWNNEILSVVYPIE